MKAYTLQVYRSHRQWRWRIVARNGKKVAVGGEGYERIGKLLRTVKRLFAGTNVGSQAGELDAERHL